MGKKDSLTDNKMRKAKVDMIAKYLDDLSIEWNWEESNNNVFQFIIADKSIDVSPENISFILNGEYIDLKDKNFSNKLQLFLKSLVNA